MGDEKDERKRKENEEEPSVGPVLESNSHLPAGSNLSRPGSRRLAAPPAGRPRKQVERQDPLLPGRGRGSSPSTGEAEGAEPGSTCTGTSQHLQQGGGRVGGTMSLRGNQSSPPRVACN